MVWVIVIEDGLLRATGLSIAGDRSVEDLESSAVLSMDDHAHAHVVSL